MKYDELYNKAIEKIGEGEYEEALKYLDEAIKENENDTRAWIAKATALMDLKDYEKAIEIIDRVITMDENDDFVVALKGVALYETGRDGSEFLDRALKMNPKNFTAMYWKGVVEGRAGRKENEAELKGNAAFILFAAGGDAEALRIFREVYYSGVDLPIRYECGIAYAAMVDYVIPLVDKKDAEKLIEEMDKIIEDCWEHRNMICESARVLLNDMVGEEVKNIVVNDEKDLVFKKLFEPWQEEVENGEEKEN